MTHAGGGGVDRVIATRVAALHAAGIRPIVLRPDAKSVVVGDGSTPNLRFAMPDEQDALVRLLRAERPSHVELHHDLGHDPAVLDLAARLGVPHEVHVHDYAWFCPRIALVPNMPIAANRRSPGARPALPTMAATSRRRLPSPNWWRAPAACSPARARSWRPRRMLRLACAGISRPSGRR
ncbi:MAG: hypothetical protein WDN49_22075 [Acetobacteraceae bacterium]